MSAHTPEVGEKQWVERDKKKRVIVNNGQLRFRPPPQVEHASCLDQFLPECWDWIYKDRVDNLAHDMVSNVTNADFCGLQNMQNS